MIKLDWNNRLKVEFINDIGSLSDIDNRKYTLTHSDETGQLFLTVGKEYNYEKIDEKRDEVLGKWTKKDDEYILKLKVLVDINKGLQSVILRDKIFRKELPLAITAILYGDKSFLDNNAELYKSKVIVEFKAYIEEYNVTEEFGIVKDYLDMDRVEFKQGNPLFPGSTPFNYPVQYGPNEQENKFPNNKGNVIEKALISTLAPYIKTEINTNYGPNIPYCLKRAEILSARTIKSYGPCDEEYEVVVGLKVGKKQPYNNNMIITFSISSNRIIVKSVKNPRES